MLPTVDSPCIFDKFVSCLLYADDVTIMSTSKAGLQRALDQLDAYCQDWGLEVNGKKSHVVCFSKKKQVSHGVNFTLNGESLNQTKTCNFLGFAIHCNGKLDLVQNTLINKASRALFNMYKMPGFKSLSIVQQIQLFNSLIKPILTYGSEVWGINPIASLLKKNSRNQLVFNLGAKFNLWGAQKVMNRFCRLVLGLHRKSPVLPMLGDLGLTPIYVDIVSSAVKYWLNVMKNGNHSSLVYQSMLEMFNFDSNGKHFNFLSCIRVLLYNFKLHGIWDNRGCTNINKGAHIFKKYLLNDFKVYWKNEIGDATRSRYNFYHKVKFGYNIENYLLQINDFSLKSIIARLRTSTHNLMVEKGRHLGIDRVNRLCTKCNVLEDEEHMLFTCHKHEEARKAFNLDNLDIVKLVSNFQTGHNLINIAKYLKSCLNS